MKQQLIDYLLASKKHWEEQQKKASEALALIIFELECVENYSKS